MVSVPALISGAEEVSPLWTKLPSPHHPRTPHSGKASAQDPSPYHLCACSIPLVCLPPSPIEAVEHNKLGDVEAGEPLSGPLGFYAVNNGGMQKIHLRMKVRDSLMMENPSHVQAMPCKPKNLLPPDITEDWLQK